MLRHFPSGLEISYEFNTSFDITTMRLLRYFLPAFVLSIVICSSSVAQVFRVLQDDDWCDEGRYSNDRDYRHCEVREITLPADRNVITVDGGQNGGISVEGWTRDEILLRAKVQARGRSSARAEDLVDAVDIVTGRRAMAAEVPRTRSRESVSVSFFIYVPAESNLDIEANNGGIHIDGVAGEIEFDTRNGGVSLVGLSGDVRGLTRNGGLDIELEGRQWDGDGMDVETRNGGIELYIPEDYSARLETGTVNGRVRVDFPITVQGDIGRRLSTVLGRGGRTVRAVTTNGGVTIKHR